MTTYQVEVTREGQWWVAVVDGLAGGATEASSLVALEVEVRDLISGLTNADEQAFDVDLDYSRAFPTNR